MIEKLKISFVRFWAGGRSAEDWAEKRVLGSKPIVDKNMESVYVGGRCQNTFREMPRYP